MSLRKTARGVWVLCMLALGAPLSALAQNAASAEATWPGPLDYVRQYPWPSVGALAIVLGLASLIDLRSKPERTPPSDTANAGQHFDMRGANINGAFTAGNHPSSHTSLPAEGPVGTSTEEAHAESATLLSTASEAASTKQQPLQHVSVLFETSEFLEDGDWEARAFETAERAHEHGLVIRLRDQRAEHLPAGAVVLVCNSAHFRKIKKTMVEALAYAQQHHPGAVTIVLAVGLADRGLSREEFLRWREAAGHSGEYRFRQCATEADLAGFEDQLRACLSMSLNALRSTPQPPPEQGAN